MENYLNVSLSPEDRAAALLADLSLEEKLAQVNGIFPFGPLVTDYDYIREHVQNGIGEVSTLEVRSMKTLEEAATWQRRVQEIVLEASPHRIPAIFHMEGLCGTFIQDSTSFPSGIARGASFDPELEEAIARTVARQETACGITHIFAPVLDVARDPRFGRTGESYGEDPALASAMGAAYTRGAQGTGTDGRRADCVAKHFLAFHTAQGGIHGTVSEIPPRPMAEVFGKPFQAAIAEADLHGIMPCYCPIDGEPVSASKRILTDLLREEMGFDGVAVSDYGAVGQVFETHRIGETLGEAGLRCMEAGMDVELPETTGFGPELRRLFETGEADSAILDRAVFRVLTAKFRMGLFEHPFALAGEALQAAVVSPGDRELSLRSARESLVLLKNDGALPLSKDIKTLAVIGPHAAFARKMFGGYTHLCMQESTFAAANSIAGVAGTVQADPAAIVTVPGTSIQSDEAPELEDILRRQKPDCVSLLTELQNRLPGVKIVYAYGYPIAGEDRSRFPEALEAVRRADAAILTLGGKHGTCSLASMGEGVDASDINLPACQDRFIEEAAALGVPLIGVHFDGRPISSDAADRHLSAILECWSPAETGAQAVADALLGVTDPGGRLPVTVARLAGQIPVYYNHPRGSAWHQSGSIGFANYVDLPHAPRYPFGYGLSYTSFDYTDLELSEKEIGPEGSISVSVTVRNTGAVPGSDVVQLYITDERASMVRPVLELAGFRRLDLAPGEAKRVTFTLRASQTAFLDRETRWKVEAGKFTLKIGASSEDIRLTGSFRVTENAWIRGRDRAFYAKSRVEEV